MPEPTRPHLSRWLRAALTLAGGVVGALGIAACPTYYGPAPIDTCNSDSDCASKVGPGWYCASGHCEPAPPDGGIPDAH